MSYLFFCSSFPACYHILSPLVVPLLFLVVYGSRYFNGKNIIIKAVRPMEKNEVLSENYGPHYGKKSLRDRTRELTSRYWFKCECVACTEDWPLIEELGPDDWKLRYCASLG